MGSGEVLQIESLIAPIAGAAPSGTNLRNGGGRDLYDAIRGARSTARIREKPQMMGDPNAPASAPEEWRTVLDKSVQALGSRSKDLEIATYLIEALIRLHGFAGLRDGFRLYRGLVENYWDTLFPALDEDGPIGRMAALAGLNGDGNRDGALLFPISRVPLTETSVGGFGLFQYEHALAMEKLPPERQEERIREGQVSLKMFQAAAYATPIEFYSQLLKDIEQSSEEFDKLTATLESRCGAELAPPSSRIREALQRCRTVVEQVALPRLGEQSPVEGNTGADMRDDTSAGAGAGLVGRSGTIRNRDEAFQTIDRVAQFFRQTEPQSPVIFALEQVVRWGRMPLPDLLSELIPDDSARQRLFERIGIRPAEPTGGG